MSSESEEIEQPQQQRNRPLKYTVNRRLNLEGRWKEAEPVRDELMRHARKSLKLPKEEAQDWVYSELDRRYPPQFETEKKGDNSIATDTVVEVTDSRTRTRGETATGINSIPADWPQLPANASLAAEIQWVQANRLRVVVSESDGCTTVDLSRSLLPAPSHSALGWLETSIRAYAKYCEIAAKATQSLEDETSNVRRERQAIDQIRGLLAEMLEE